jgi:hypothetical protein
LCRIRTATRERPPPPGGGGLFTHYLLQGLQTGSADEDGDHQISIEELHRWLKPRVARAALQDNRKQTPSLTQPEGGATEIPLLWGLP